MMALMLVTPPESTPVSLEEAQIHLRVVDDDENSLIETFIEAATAHAERFLGRSLIDQIWELTLDEFPENEIKLPKPPLIEVVSIKYDDAAGDEQMLSTDSYTVDTSSEPGWVVPADSWPSTFDGINTVRIQFRAGYIDQTMSPAVANVPQDIRAAILLMIGTFYNSRETIVIGQTATLIPWGAEQLLRMRRIDLSMA